MMFNKILRLASAGGAAAILLLTLSGPARAQATLLMLGNKTPVAIQFYVDGQPACTAETDAYCKYPTSAGAHAISAKRKDPEQTVCEAKIEVPAGMFMWFCEVQS